MKRILVPISFSSTSRCALVTAHAIAQEYGATLSLLHCYPSQDYNRVYEFQGKDYNTGIRELLQSFYNESISEKNKGNYRLIPFEGNVSEIVSKVSSKYDLLVMSRNTGFPEQKKTYFSDKLIYISTKAKCPILITTNQRHDFLFQNADNIWHIERNEKEKNIVDDKIRDIGLDPKNVITKSFSQKQFVSDFWKKMVSFSKTHDKALLNALSKSYRQENIHLLILVNRIKGIFEGFIKDEVFQFISQCDIPILILQSKKR